MRLRTLQYIRCYCTPLLLPVKLLLAQEVVYCDVLAADALCLSLLQLGLCSGAGVYKHYDVHEKGLAVSSIGLLEAA
jgi:hypothetical protein